MTFKLPSVRLRKSLAKAQARYAEQVTTAAGFLNERGITIETAKRWGIGVVSSPIPSHEHLTGRLSVPYWNAAGEVVGFTFRCLIGHDCSEHGCKKYMLPLGQPNLLYNVAALDDPGSTVHVTEGELDTVALAETLGEPTVGVSGGDKWEPHWVAHFRPWERVLIWADGDKAGRNMAAMWSKRVTCEIAEMPKGHDVTSFLLEHGIDGLKQLAGGDDVSGDSQ